MDDESSQILNLGGGSLLIAWQLKGKNVLIAGGGVVASTRIASILQTDAQITVISPQDGLDPQTQKYIELRRDRIFHHDRKFQGPDDLFGVDMVLTALDDTDLSRSIVEMSRERRIPVNAADIPDLCDFYFGAQIRDGPLQIMVSTNGKGPRMASIITTKLRNALSGKEGVAIVKVGQLREKLKERAPGIGGNVSRERMQWMTRLCQIWDMEDFALLDDALIEELLDRGWDTGLRVPHPQDIGLPAHSQDEASPADSPFVSAMPIFPTAIAFVAGALTIISILAYRGRT